MSVIVSAAAGLSLTVAPLANAADYGVSIANYCARNVPSGTGAPSKAVNINNRWDGWRCATRTGLVQVSVATACRQQISPKSVAVKISDTASGWRCRI